jgi:ADP-ribose pyrophosphatase YjhB (NUDIX family)
LNTDENLTEGLLRELQEELSVECSIESIISANVYHGKEHTPKIFIFYHASVVADQEIVINNEIEEISFITKKEDLENRPMWRNQREVIEQFLS